MAQMMIYVAVCLLVSVALALPANNDQLDKATVNDVAVNAVSSDKKAALTDAQKQANSASIEISGISTGLDSTEPVTTNSFIPQRAGSMFARFIDDIFQIPITVLQSVAKLITNPFTTAKKNTEVTDS